MARGRQGHNSGVFPGSPRSGLGGVASDGPSFAGPIGAERRAETNADPLQGDALKSLVQRIERREEEKRNLAADIREVYAEAKGAGFDAKILRKVIALRARPIAERQEEETLIDIYLQAVGETA